MSPGNDNPSSNLSNGYYDSLNLSLSSVFKCTQDFVLIGKDNRHRDSPLKEAFSSCSPRAQAMWGSRGNGKFGPEPS